MKRIILTGSESTGKTVLAAELAEHFKAPLVPEFLRSYAADRGGKVGWEDVAAIATGQIENEERVVLQRSADHTRELLILDTDLLSSVVYNRHYYGSSPAWIEKAVRDQSASLYLLMDVDVPWVSDELRDRGDRREELQNLFRKALDEFQLRWIPIRGGWDVRRVQAIAAIEKCLTS